MDPANHEERPRLLPEPNPPVNVIYFKLFDGELLWGASARLTLALIRALIHSEAVSNEPIIRFLAEPSHLI